MKEYKELLEKVQEYLNDDNNPEIKSGEITAYELYGIVDRTIKELYPKEKLDDLLQNINHDNPISIKSKLDRLFKKNKKSGLYFDRYKSIYIDYDKICLTFISDDDIDDNHFSIYKEQNTFELYTDHGNLNEFEKKILDNHYDEILDILTILQEHSNIMNIHNHDVDLRREESFSDGFMEGVISYSCYGQLDLNIGITYEEDCCGISKRDYYRIPKIQDIIDDNKEEISKKLVINEDKLSYDFKKILKRNKKKNEMTQKER